MEAKTTPCRQSISVEERQPENAPEVDEGNIRDLIPGQAQDEASLPTADGMFQTNFLITIICRFVLS